MMRRDVLEEGHGIILGFNYSSLLKSFCDFVLEMLQISRRL